MSVEFRILLDLDLSIEGLHDLLVNEFVLSQSPTHLNVVYSDNITLFLEKPSLLCRKLLLQAYKFDASLMIIVRKHGEGGSDALIRLVEYFLGFYKCDLHFGIDTGTVYLFRRDNEVFINDVAGYSNRRLASFCEENGFTYTITELPNH